VNMQISEGPSAKYMTWSLFQFSTTLYLCLSTAQKKKLFYLSRLISYCFWQWNCCINGNEIRWQHCEGKIEIM